MHNLEISKINAASVLDNADTPGSKPFELSFAGSRVRATKIAEVGYLPGPRLQIVAGEVFPVETGFDDIDLSIMKTHHVGKRTGAASARDLVAIDGEVCVLCNPWSINFSHWIEELTKVVVLEENEFSGRYVIPKWSIAREAMLLAGVAEHRIIDTPQTPAVFEEAVFLERYNFADAFARPARFRSVRDRLLAATPTATHTGERLWITRAGNRQIVNFDDVLPILNQYQVGIIDFAQQSLAEQVATSRNASLLSGPHGSGFMHALFALEGAAIVECFSPEWLNPTWTSVYRMMNQAYSQIVPVSTEFVPYRFGQDIYVDIDHLALSFATLLEH